MECISAFNNARCPFDRRSDSYTSPLPYLYTPPLPQSTSPSSDPEADSSTAIVAGAAAGAAAALLAAVATLFYFLKKRSKNHGDSHEVVTGSVRARHVQMQDNI